LDKINGTNSPRKTHAHTEREGGFRTRPLRQAKMRRKRAKYASSNKTNGAKWKGIRSRKKILRRTKLNQSKAID